MGAAEAMHVRRAMGTQQEAHIRSCRQGHEEYLEGSTAGRHHCRRTVSSVSGGLLVAII